jgi:hypothetical protein
LAEWRDRTLDAIKSEEVYLSENETSQDAPKQPVRFIDTVNNKKRIHSALGDLRLTRCQAI